MTDAPTIESSSPEKDIELAAAGSTAIANRLRDLARRKESIEREIRRLEILGGESTPWWDCKRCGYHWKGYNIIRPPHHCPRCHSTGWRNAPWSSRCRKPSDPPNPKWKVGRNKQPERTGVAAIVRAVEFPGSSHAEGVHERLSKLTRSMLDTDGRYIPPPSLPPPPISLSSQLREVMRFPVPAQEEQPERLSAPPPPIHEPDPEPVEPDISPDITDDELVSPEDQP